MTKTLEIGHDYAGIFLVAKGTKLIYNGDISWTGIAPDGKSMTMDSQQQTDAATKAINSTINMGGLISIGAEMTITKSYADRLIREGRATKTTTITDDKGHTFQAIDRHDLQRVDHYRI